MLGDADDGLVVRLAQGGDFSPYRSLLATGRSCSTEVIQAQGRCCGRQDALAPRQRFGCAVPGAKPGTDAVPLRQAFPAGGYYILGCDFETEREIRLIAMRAVATGASPRTGMRTPSRLRCRSAAWSSWSIRETYVYHTQVHAPLFSRTSAHNTLRVTEGPIAIRRQLIVAREARAGCKPLVEHAREGFIEGWQDGYMRLADPVMHRRRVALDKAARRVVIEDSCRWRGARYRSCFSLQRAMPGRSLAGRVRVTQGRERSSSACRISRTAVLRLPRQQCADLRMGIEAVSTTSSVTDHRVAARLEAKSSCAGEIIADPVEQWRRFPRSP